jgi:hypothetical protein
VGDIHTEDLIYRRNLKNRAWLGILGGAVFFYGLGAQSNAGHLPGVVLVLAGVVLVSLWLFGVFSVLRSASFILLMGVWFYAVVRAHAHGWSSWVVVPVAGILATCSGLVLALVIDRIENALGRKAPSPPSTTPIWKDAP